MSRSRNIKPGFLLNDHLGELDPLARLLFIGFWTVADYKGEFEWREKRLKAQLLAYDNCDIKKLAISLDKSGFIRFYSDGAAIYCKVVNFNVHQNPHKNEREKGSDIPKMTESMRQAVDLKGLTINRDLSGLNHEHSDSDPADSLFLIPDSCSLIPDSLPSKIQAKSKKFNPTVDMWSDWGFPDKPSTEIFNAWLAMRREKKYTISELSFKGIGAGLRDAVQAGFTVDQCLTKAEGSSWKGFEANWMINSQSSARPSYQGTQPSQKGFLDDDDDDFIDGEVVNG